MLDDGSVDDYVDDLIERPRRGRGRAREGGASVLSAEDPLGMMEGRVALLPPRLTGQIAGSARKPMCHFAYPE